MSSRTIDFLVVGGGPAGCAFATLAARAGASVALIERDDYQRPRPGEHLAGRVRPMLDALHVPTQDAALLAAPSPGILSAWNGADLLLKLYGASGQAIGLRVLRHRFDELLCRTARHAGAAVFLSSRPTRVERLRSRQWSVTIAGSDGPAHVLARSLVDATGRSAYIARKQGAHRVSHGDLIAIVRWLDVRNPPPDRDTMLTVESCAHGWCSISVLRSRTLVVTLYTSLSMMRSARAKPEAWWRQAVDGTDTIRAIVEACRPDGGGVIAAYRACPSRSSLLAGDGWIAIGDAAIALDPLAGQGVTLALETAFRAFEAARVDPSWNLLGGDYSDALTSRFATHLDRRIGVYAEAAPVLSRSFVGPAVEEVAMDLASE